MSSAKYYADNIKVYDASGWKYAHILGLCDILTIRKDSIGIFGGEWLKPISVKLKFDPDIVETIADRVWHPSQKIKKHRDSSVTLSMRVVISDEPLGWIGSWQHYVEVLGPRELRKEVITRIESNKRRYQDGKHQ